MHRRTLTLLALAATLSLPAAATAADPAAVAELLNQYGSEGATQFDATWARGEWTREFQADDGKMRSCITCHGDDLKKPGRHAKTGKVIDPMARSVNPDRLTDVKKIEKWFKRNCEWTWGRECTPTEKGSFLKFLNDT